MKDKITYDKLPVHVTRRTHHLIINHHHLFLWRCQQHPSHFNAYHVAQRMKWKYSSPLFCLSTVASTTPAICAWAHMNRGQDHLFKWVLAQFYSHLSNEMDVLGSSLLRPKCDNVLKDHPLFFWRGDGKQRQLHKLFRQRTFQFCKICSRQSHSSCNIFQQCCLDLVCNLVKWLLQVREGEPRPETRPALADMSLHVQNSVLSSQHYSTCSDGKSLTVMCLLYVVVINGSQASTVCATSGPNQ